MRSEKLFTIIKDGAWHNLNELSERLGIPAAKLIKCARDLRDKGIVKYQDNPKAIKIEPKWAGFIPD